MVCSCDSSDVGPLREIRWFRVLSSRQSAEDGRRAFLSPIGSAITYLTNQGENLRQSAAALCVRTESGSDRIRRNLRNPAGLLDPVATALGSDPMPIILISQVCLPLGEGWG